MPESDKELWKLPYYHGLLPREDTVTFLKNNGDFLVRKSEENPGDKRSFVLSVQYQGQAKHFLMREEKGRIAVDFKMDDNGFKTIKEFVDTHLRMKTSISSGSRITISTGVPKRDWELAHSMVESGAKLGSGAFGIVRRGLLKLPGRENIKVAIKEATLTKCTKEQIKEFMNEARVMRKFKHANVIEFFGVAVGEEPLMIVMELATNGALKDYLQQHGRHFKSKYYMCLGAAAGMSHIHEKSVIHCDIAARNCLYSENKVKIADFGLARELKGISKISLDKNQRLPIKWLAPETMKDRICTKKTDTWAFGILCWEIFEDGSPPYPNIKNNTDVAKRVIKGERLAFKEDVHKDFASYITKQVWHGEAAERCSMQSAFDWIQTFIKKHYPEDFAPRDNAQKTGRNEKSGKDVPRTKKTTSAKDP